MLAKILLAAATVVTFTTATTAQVWGGPLLGGGFYYQATPPVLPAVQSRIGSYDRTIGNSWLGGSAHVYAGIVRQKSGTYELGNAAAEFHGTARLLQASAEVAEIVGGATNIMNNGVQNRSGYFRIDLLGVSIVNSSFTNNSTFASATSLFNLIPGGVSYPIPVGPVTVTVAGNAGCGFTRGANWLLPAASARVGLNASASAHAFADANVGVGIPGFGLGVGINGKILEQTLSANVNADAVWGLSGSVYYQLKAITLTLYAWAQAIWTWTTNLTSWSAGLVNLSLL